MKTENKKVRFDFDLARCTNRAESVTPWNLIISARLNPYFVIAYPNFHLFLVCLLGLNKRRVYNRS